MTAPQDVRRLKYAVEACVNGVWGDEPDGEDDMVVVRVADFDRAKGVATLGDSPTVRGIPESARNRRVLRPGDLLIEKSGGGEQQPVGNVVLFTDDRPAVCSNFVARMPVVADCDSRFVGYVFRALYAEGRNFPHIKQTSGIQNLDSESYLNETAWLPARGQQEHIANFLDVQTARIDALIAEKERLASAVEELTLSRLVSASLANNPVSGTYWEAVSKAKIPEDWRLTPLRALFEESSLKNDGVVNENYLSLVSGVGVIPYAEKGDLGNKKPDDLNKCKVVQVGDFVLNCMNFGIGAFGVSPQLGVCSPVYIVLRAKVADAQLEFLRLLFSSQYFQKSVQSLGRGIMELRYAFGWDDIKNLNVPMPNADIAAEVCRALTQIQASGKALRKHVDEHIERLREYRSSLISAAVTGQLDMSTAVSKSR